MLGMSARHFAGLPKEWSEQLIYLPGLKNAVRQPLLLAGEDLINDCIWIAFKDFPRWLEAGAETEILMPREDYVRMVKYFRKVDLRKYRMKRMLAEKYAKFKKR